MAPIAPLQLESREPSPPVWRLKITREMYYRLAELGFFEDRQVELIEGEVIEMSPVSPRHFASGDRIQKLFNAVFGEGYWVRFQGPLVLGDSEPQPDIAVVEGTPEMYQQEHPHKAVLVVEISDATLQYDRTYKLSLYARAGIPEYWIVNLKEQLLEIYREPIPLEETPFGYGYRIREIRRPGETVHPLIKPDVALAVSELLR
jgi:Uma2 family endonuclease